MNKGQRLKYARQDAGLSQLQLANAAGINQAQISRMERGEMWASNAVLAKIASAIGIPVAELLDVDGLVPQQEPAPAMDSAKAIRSNKALPAGLREFAKNSKLIDALDIRPAEWIALASLKPPRPIDEHGYLALLTTIRSVTKT